MKHIQLYALFFQNAVVAAELGLLVSGISGATVLAVFSSDLPGTFIMPRTVPATAVLFAEPGAATIPRQSTQSASNSHSCGRPILSLRPKLNTATEILSPILNTVSKVTKPISTFKSNAVQKLGLACLFPKLLRPFEPTFKYARCLLGLDDDDGFMETPSCNSDTCKEPTLEEREITQDLGLPNLDFMIRDEVSTMDDCFEDMAKVTYGSRILVKLVDDQSCDDPRYESICLEALEQERIIMEDNCRTIGYMPLKIIFSLYIYIYI